MSTPVTTGLGGQGELVTLGYGTGVAAGAVAYGSPVTMGLGGGALVTFGLGGPGAGPGPGPGPAPSPAGVKGGGGGGGGAFWQDDVAQAEFYIDELGTKVIDFISPQVAKMQRTQGEPLIEVLHSHMRAPQTIVKPSPVIIDAQMALVRGLQDQISALTADQRSSAALIVALKGELATAKVQLQHLQWQMAASELRGGAALAGLMEAQQQRQREELLKGLAIGALLGGILVYIYLEYLEGD